MHRRSPPHHPSQLVSPVIFHLFPGRDSRFHVAGVEIRGRTLPVSYAEIGVRIASMELEMQIERVRIAVATTLEAAPA